MAQDTRRFDDLGQTLRTMQTQIDALKAAALNRIATHTHASIAALGTVDPAYASGQPRVTIDGTSGLTVAGLQRLSSYTPAAADRVVLALVGGGDVILGKVV